MHRVNKEDWTYPLMNNENDAIDVGVDLQAMGQILFW